MSFERSTEQNLPHAGRLPLIREIIASESNEIFKPDREAYFSHRVDLLFFGQKTKKKKKRKKKKRKDKRETEFIIVI